MEQFKQAVNNEQTMVVIKWGREQQGLTQQQFVDLCGTSRSTINKIEEG
jgi:transcriptional regulator with XRE-family HTH domain